MTAFLLKNDYIVFCITFTRSVLHRSRPLVVAITSVAPWVTTVAGWSGKVAGASSAAVATLAPWTDHCLRPAYNLDTDVVYGSEMIIVEESSKSSLPRCWVLLEPNIWGSMWDLTGKCGVREKVKDVCSYWSWWWSI